jgi:hypothetical protein
LRRKAEPRPSAIRLTFDYDREDLVTIRRFLFASAAVLIASAALAQERGPRIVRATPPDLQRAADIIREWQQQRTAEGARVCRFQAVLNIFIDVDRVLDPMQPNVSNSKVLDRLAAAHKIVPTDRDSVSFRLRALLITADQIFDPHASPDVAAQRERFHREVLDPAHRLVTPEVISFVETAQQIDLALRTVSQTQSDMSALILHAIHGDCVQPQER